MELLPTPETGGVSAVAPEHAGGPPVAPTPDLAERLAAVERRLENISDRLARVEASLGPTVAQEVKGATSELARAITELGRRLALDLPHELRRHRDVIVSELRPPPPPPPPPPPAPEFDDVPAPIDLQDTEAPPDDDAPDGGGAPAGRRVPRRRRRHG
jgi:hypothetical protein